MSVDITLRTQPALLIVTFQGVCHFTDILATLAEIRGDPRVTAGTPRMWDMRAASFRLNATDIRNIATWLSRRPPIEQPPRLALIVHQRSVTYGLLRMLQSYMELAHVPTSLHLCASPTDGLIWLGLDPAIPDAPDTSE